MTRLDTIASLIKNNSKVCDIGCDHAYLLLKIYDKIKLGFACDIAQKPLNTAIKTINEHKLSEKITPILSNGLENIEKDSFDTLVIAGMGGELISKILTDCPYIKNKNYDIFLQPMKKAEELRYFLYKNGFSIENEVISIENNRIYTIIYAKYTGIIENKTLEDCFLSEALTKDKNFDKFLKYHIERFKNITKKMENSENNANLEFFNNILSKLKEY